MKTSMQYKLDTYNNTVYMIESMISEESDRDRSKRELYKTYFEKVLKTDFMEEYGIELKYNENYSQQLKELKKIRKSLILNDL